MYFQMICDDYICVVFTKENWGPSRFQIFCLFAVSLPESREALQGHHSWYRISYLYIQIPIRLWAKILARLNVLTVTGKAIPLHAWTGPEGSRRLRLPDFKTISIWRW